MTVAITRAVSEAALIQSRVGRLWHFRQERLNAKSLAAAALGVVRQPNQVRLIGIKVYRLPAERTVLMAMQFERVHPHTYRPVARCNNCARRWGEHEEWEKA